MYIFLNLTTTQGQWVGSLTSPHYLAVTSNDIHFKFAFGDFNCSYAAVVPHYLNIIHVIVNIKNLIRRNISRVTLERDHVLEGTGMVHCSQECACVRSYRNTCMAPIPHSTKKTIYPWTLRKKHYIFITVLVIISLAYETLTDHPFSVIDELRVCFLFCFVFPPKLGMGLYKQIEELWHKTFYKKYFCKTTWLRRDVLSLAPDWSFAQGEAKCPMWKWN